ncbi:hypothetical protein AAFC00_001062 [Neodothiora populina]|uniref:Tryptophan synthase beta chain-like PALP domain-containing protein n=1 Tax=Neodothiora populina TaxID=2781224 RepID=A0ABR3PMT6_9PEZI
MLVSPEQSHDEFAVTHLDTKCVYHRNHVFVNPHRKSISSLVPTDPAVEAFHKTLPHYAPTPLRSLPELAGELGVAHVFVKDESARFGLPSFKILGASWAIYRTVCEKTGLPPDVSMVDAGDAAKRHSLVLITCSCGNWGRAVARMATYLGIRAIVFVPNGVSDASRTKMSDEGAEVIAVNGSYDDSIEAAVRRGDDAGALLVFDTSWEGFETVPKWVVEGYCTMLSEADHQVYQSCRRTPSTCVVPVGVGSVAQAVIAHYTAKDPNIHNITVESEAAPCLLESLHHDRSIPLETGQTILPPLNCGTLSMLAWPVLKDGVYASIAVSDVEAHQNLQYLNSNGINAGPCGGATLAAARRLHESSLIGQGPDGVLVLFSTEGMRGYDDPLEKCSVR